MVSALCVRVIARSFQRRAFVARAARPVAFVWRVATMWRLLGRQVLLTLAPLFGQVSNMAGWRDTEGRTARERAKWRGTEERAAFMRIARHRPLTLVKGLFGFGFVLLLVFALVAALR